MHPILLIIAIAIANIATLWLTIKIRGSRALAVGITSMTRPLADSSVSKQITILCVAVISEELSFRFGVPAILAQHGISRANSRVISSLIFGAVHLLNSLVLTGNIMLQIHQATFSAMLGYVLFDFRSIVNCVLYHCLYNIVAGGLAKLLMMYMQRDELENAGFTPIANGAVPTTYISIDRTTSPDSFRNHCIINYARGEKASVLHDELESALEQAMERRASARGERRVFIGDY
jgi:hypothetical protein